MTDPKQKIVKTCYRLHHDRHGLDETRVYCQPASVPQTGDQLVSESGASPLAVQRREVHLEPLKEDTVVITPLVQVFTLRVVDSGCV